jgi:tetratricopeptide (TPR) repeat protein
MIKMPLLLKIIIITSFLFFSSKSYSAKEQAFTNTDYQIEKIQKLSWSGDYNKAINEYQKILDKDPKNLKALDGKAEVTSWQGNYLEAIKIYDQRLAIKYDSKIARQQARVLGWGQYYSRSINAYEEAYKKESEAKKNSFSNISKLIKLEMLAKKNWWNNRPLDAQKYYKQLLELEPDNLEARSDLAQLQGNESIYYPALENFEYITSRYDWHFMAREGRDKLDINHSSPALRFNNMWFDSISSDRYTEIRRLYSELIFELPIYKNHKFKLGYNLDNFNYRSAPSIISHYALIGWESNINGRFWFDGIYGIAFKNPDNLVSQKFNARASFKPFEPLIVSVFSGREAQNNSRQVLLNRIAVLNTGADLRINWHRTTSTILEYRRDFLSNTNRANWMAWEQVFSLLYAPKELSLSTRFQYQDWKTTETIYFSPKNFWSIPINLRWRHYLNAKNMYFGACDTYYGFRYQFQVDKGKIIFNGLGAEFHHDFTQRFALHYEVFGNYSSVYKDFMMILSFVGYL